MMINMDNEKNYEIARARSQSYGLFSTIFLGDWDGLLSQLPNEIDFNKGDFFSFLNQLMDTDKFELKVQYDNLFVAPGFYFVSPYLSSYVSDEHDVNSDLSFLYQNTGLEIFDKRLEPQDHIANLLSYMQWLLSLEDMEWQNGNKQKATEILNLEKVFITKYLYWIPELRNNISKKLEYGFMLDAANKLNELVSWHLHDLYDQIQDK